MTIEQFLTVAGFVLAAGIAVFVAVVIGHQIARFIRAVGRIAEVVTTILARILRLALIGAVALGLVAGGIWWAIQPTASAAPAPSTSRPTPTSTTSRAELPVMSPIEAQAYGEGFMFISSYDHTVCTLHAVDYQEELVGYCE
jgi:hypothetical protein